MYKIINKKFITIFVFGIIFLGIVFNFDQIRSTARSLLPVKIKIYVKELFFGKQFLKEIAYYRKINYNQKILPQTQFENINLTKFNLNNFNKDKDQTNPIKRFYFEIYNNDLIIATAKGEIKLVENIKFENIKSIKTNLKEFKISKLMDIKLINDNLFISFASKKNEKDNCKFFSLVQAQFNKNNLKFENFYKSKECLISTYGGKIDHFKLKNDEGVLLATGATSGHGLSPKEKNLAQDEKSIAGKVLFINFKNKEETIISKGHRFPQGLFVKNDLILLTEGNNYGGDEINKIIMNGNYGWPISSYGEGDNYNKIIKERLDYEYEKNHSNFNFIEPIFSFVPSIGITEIIKIPNEFSKYWQNNYFVSSLGTNLYRVRFDKKYSKILYFEKIPIGESIRDIIYIPKIKAFALSLTGSGSIALIKINE